MDAKNSRRLVVVAAAIVVGLVVAWNIRQGLLLIYVSAVFAVVLKPGIDRLHRTSLFGWRPGRAAALLLLVLLLCIVIGGIMAIALPSIIANVADFADTMNKQSGALQKRLESITLLKHVRFFNLQSKIPATVGRGLPAVGGATAHILTGLF